MEKPFQRECTNVQWQPNWIMDHHSLCIKERFSSVQSLNRVQLFATPWIAAYQASLSITNSQSLLKLMSIESVMPSSHLILCHPLLLLPSIPPSIRVFSNESTLRMRWPEYWSFSFSISPSNEHPGLISFRRDWLDHDYERHTPWWQGKPAHMIYLWIHVLPQNNLLTLPSLLFWLIDTLCLSSVINPQVIHVLTHVFCLSNWYFQMSISVLSLHG